MNATATTARAVGSAEEGVRIEYTEGGELEPTHPLVEQAQKDAAEKNSMWAKEYTKNQALTKELDELKAQLAGIQSVTSCTVTPSCTTPRPTAKKPPLRPPRKLCSDPARRTRPPGGGSESRAPIPQHHANGVLTMALRIIRSTDPITVNRLNVCIYAAPGLGKTSISFTADKPLLLDFDRGAHRSANRKDTVQVERWEDVAHITADDLADFNTVVVDTAGRALDTLTPDIIRRNPKMGRGGSLTLQGFGQLKSEFVAWLKHLNSLGRTWC